MKLFSTKFISPLKKNIIIFDEVQIELLKKIIKTKYSSIVIKRRPPEYYISFNLIKKFILFLSDFSFHEVFNSSEGIVKGFFAELRFIYYKSLVELINPLAVITFIDNNFIFNQLSRRTNKIPFIAIQNGLRLSHENAINYHVQHLFSLGHNETKYFKKIGYEVENFYPCGSLIGSKFLKKSDDFKKKYDVLVVSSWRGNIGYPIDQVDTMNSMNVLDTLISKYIKSNNIKVAVALRNERDGDNWFVPEIGKNEEEYFKEIYGNNVDLIDVDFKSRNIYGLINKSTLIISGFSTTVLLEAYGFQKKIMYYNFTKKDIYHSIFDSSIVSTNSDYFSFSKELDELLKVSQTQYIKNHMSNMKYYMSFPKDMEHKDYVLNKIDEIIKD